MLTIKILSKLTFCLLVTLWSVKRIDAAYFYPRPTSKQFEEAPVKTIPNLDATLLKEYQAVASSFIDCSKMLKCLTTEQFSATCDPVSKIYLAMDNEVVDNKNFLTNEQHDCDNLDYLIQSNKRLLKSLQNISEKCNTSCSQQQASDHQSHLEAIPNEIMQLIKQMKYAGTGMLQVLEKHPNDATLKNLGKMLDKYVTDVNDDDDDIVVRTSVGMVLFHMRKMNQKMEQL